MAFRRNVRRGSKGRVRRLPKFHGWLPWWTLATLDLLSHCEFLCVRQYNFSNYSAALAGRGEARQWSVIIRRRLHWQLFHSIEQRRGIYRADVLPLSASIFPASHRGKIEQSPCFLRRCGIIARVFFHYLSRLRARQNDDNRPLDSVSSIVLCRRDINALTRIVGDDFH